MRCSWRDLDSTSANRFVGMYVNDRTLDYEADGRAAIAKFLEMASSAASSRIKYMLILSADLRAQRRFSSA